MTPLEARINYKPGWYTIAMKEGPPLVRFFQDGMSWLCNPSEFFSSRVATAGQLGLSAVADVQIVYENTCQEMICKGPVTQFDPTSWTAVAEFPLLLLAVE